MELIPLASEVKLRGIIKKEMFPTEVTGTHPGEWRGQVKDY